jgi:hypothetical protein
MNSSLTLLRLFQKDESMGLAPLMIRFYYVSTYYAVDVATYPLAKVI